MGAGLDFFNSNQEKQRAEWRPNWHAVQGRSLWSQKHQEFLLSFLFMLRQESKGELVDELGGAQDQEEQDLEKIMGGQVTRNLVLSRLHYHNNFII